MGPGVGLSSLTGRTSEPIAGWADGVGGPLEETIDTVVLG